MNLLPWTNWLPSEAKLVQLADRLAATCQDQVWRLVQHQALAMSPAEARGYVRARAGLIVKHTVEAELERSQRWESAADRLRDLTTEQIVRQLSAQVRAVRPTSLRALRHAA
jgi:methylphosphotriester-DNA--protein-cysteine methyltransferase